MAVAITLPACRVTVENSAAPKARIRPAIARMKRIHASRSKRSELSREPMSFPRFRVLVAAEPSCHNAFGFLVRRIGVPGNFRETGLQLCQQLVRPDVFAGQNDQPDEQEQNTLQDRQEKSRDAEQDKGPAQHQDADSLDPEIHWFMVLD